MDDQLGLLPPLFNNDLDAFEFENIFLGDSEIDLNNFFGDVFSIPSFPPVTISADFDSAENILSDRRGLIFQRYRSDAEVYVLGKHSKEQTRCISTACVNKLHHN